MTSLLDPNRSVQVKIQNATIDKKGMEQVIQSIIRSDRVCVLTAFDIVSGDLGMVSSRAIGVHIAP